MVCPHCGNQDPTLAEEEAGTPEFRAFVCGVCSKRWREPRKGEEAKRE